MTTATSAAATADMITCELDGGRCHVIQKYLAEHHPTVSLEDYRRQFPNAPILSEKAKKLIMERQAARKTVEVAHQGFERKPMFEIFDFPRDKTLNARREPILCTVATDLDDEAASWVPDLDKAYIFDIELTKTILVGMELSENTYLWGFHGTGKTTALEQTAARTKRPFMRIQHTINTEEAHIIGQYVVRDGATQFQLGPLPIAMINGYVYCADEYDFAMPSVTSVYQPVLEGKPLIIKDAPPELRVIRPHPSFRFCATGNTNGSGDETGLYQGTQIQNAANYSRFGIVEEVGYMAPKQEVLVVASQSRIPQKDAEKLVDFANRVRESFKAGQIGNTVSPRELIKAGKIGMVRGGNFRLGLQQAFTNRLSRTDKVTVDGLAQRVFGGQ